MVAAIGATGVVRRHYTSAGDNGRLQCARDRDNIVVLPLIRLMESFPSRT